MTPAEESVLAALLGSSGAGLHELSLRPGDFSTPQGEALYRLIQDVVESGAPADPVSVIDRSRHLDDAAQRLFDPAEVWRVAGVFVSEAAMSHHAGIVAEDAARRNLVAIGNAISRRAQEGEPVEVLTGNARDALDGVSGGMGARIESATDTIDATIESLEHPVAYTETPWANLNHLIGGWRPGAMYIIGARPSVGKTVAGLQAALSLCNRGPVAYTSLEMGVDELHLRMIAQDARVDMSKINRRQLSNDDLRRVVEARVKWGRLPLFVDPSQESSIGQVVRHAWSVKRKHGLSAIVVDYIGLLDGDDPKWSEYETVTRNSRKLKRLAQSLGVPVIVLSQLNRGSEHRENKRPTSSDLRSSGALEQDADVVILMHRDFTDAPHEAELIVTKNRHGITGTAELDFVGHHAYMRDR